MATQNKDKINHLKEMLQGNYSLSLDTYYKCLISLSYELLLENEDSLALNYLQEIPVEYIKNQLPLQLKEDSLFNLTFSALVDLLNSKNISKKVNFFNNLHNLKNSSGS
jgi:hypothetical protein